MIRIYALLCMYTSAKKYFFLIFRSHMKILIFTFLSILGRPALLDMDFKCASADPLPPAGAGAPHVAAASASLY